MKSIMSLVIAFALLFSAGIPLAASVAPGPAPSSADGVSEGSGFDVPPGPLGDGDPMGPNPLAGDGISDGSDLPAPYGPA